MALIVSAASGNFNAGGTWVGGVVPTIGDEAQAANGHTITITANANCDLVSNTGTGIFTLNDGVTLTANVTNKSTTASRNCLQFTAASPAVGFIVGNCTGGTVSTAQGANNSGTGTLNVTGNSVGSSGAFSVGVNNSGTGTTNITGNVTAGSGSNAHGAYLTTGILNITGSVTGGSTSTPFGIRLEGAGTLNITGNVTASSVSGGVSHLSTNGFVNITGNVTAGAGASSIGVFNESTGLVTINGICTGGTTNGAAGVRNALTGTIRLTRAVGNAFGPGNTAGLAAAPGAANVGLGVIEIEQLEYGTFGQSPTTGTGIRFKKVGSNVAVFNYCDTAGAKTLIDATANAAMPASSDVRSGVSYASGVRTGSCAVPSASSVAFGVPVDNTTGTALLTGAAVASAVWAAATRTITGGTVDTLTNPPTVPTVVQIRQEMDSNSTKLANLDATVSSRLAPSGTLAVVTTLTNAPSVPSAASIRAEIDSNSTQLAAIKTKTDNLPASPAATGDIPSANISAIKAKTDLLNTDRLAQVSTVSTTGAQLAAALS